jgi:hypothetical protein
MSQEILTGSNKAVEKYPLGYNLASCNGDGKN